MRIKGSILAAVAAAVVIAGCGADNQADSGNSAAVEAVSGAEAAASDVAAETGETAASSADGTSSEEESDSASEGADETGSAGQTTEESDAGKSSAGTGDALVQYRNVLEHSDSLDPFTDYADPTGDYLYSLVTMLDGEGPSLLLAQEQEVGTYFARLYYYDPETETRYASTNDCIAFGVAGVGGFRGSLDLEPDGNGLRLQAWSATNPEVDVIRYTRDGDQLVSEEQASYSLIDEDSGLEDGKVIQWHELSDMRALESWPEEVSSTGDGGFPADGSDDTASAEDRSEQADADTSDAEEQEADVSASYQNGDVLSDGRTVLAGTMRVLDYQEVCSLQGISYPNPGGESYETSPYGIFVLDTPMELTFDSVDGPYAGEVNLIGTDLSVARQYDGRHITVSVGTYDGGWPSDASLPLGEPRAELQILSQ